MNKTPKNFVEGSFSIESTKIWKKTGVKFWPKVPFKSPNNLTFCMEVIEYHITTYRIPYIKFKGKQRSSWFSMSCFRDSMKSKKIMKNLKVLLNLTKGNAKKVTVKYAIHVQQVHFYTRTLNSHAVYVIRTYFAP